MRASHRSFHSRSAGFTLIEILLASTAAAIILLAVYGVFRNALHLRDSGVARIRESRGRLRASAVLRRDLQGAMVSGGVLANTLEGDSNKQGSLGTSGFPGYLKMTTTTGKDSADELYGDVQQVEYFIARDPSAGTGSGSINARQGGTLVRAVTRDLLAATTVSTPREEQILSGVESLRVAFYDGTTWQESWQANASGSGTGLGTTAAAAVSAATTSTASGSSGAGTVAAVLPQAIRLDIQQSAPSVKDHAPPPLEIVVPWTVQPFTAPTPTPATGL